MNFVDIKTKALMLLFILALGLLFVDKVAFYCGISISLINLGLYTSYKNRGTDYRYQALVIVITSTLVRFLVISGLLILALQRQFLSAKVVLVGFILGQVFFLISQLLVNKNNGK